MEVVLQLFTTDTLSHEWTNELLLPMNPETYHIDQNCEMNLSQVPYTTTGVMHVHLIWGGFYEHRE